MGRKKDWPELTDALYNSMLVCWFETPTIKYVMDELELPRSLVLHVRDNGMPDLGHPPLPTSKEVRDRKDYMSTSSGSSSGGNGKGDNEAATFLVTHEEAQRHIAKARENLEKLNDIADDMGEKAVAGELVQEADGTIANLDETKKRLDVEASRLALVEKRAITSDNVKRSAQEAALARQAFKHCLDLGTLFSHLIEAMLVGVEKGQILLPEVLDPRMITSLASSAERLTAAMERAVKLEKGRAGEPEKNIGVQIGILLNSCSEDELDGILQDGKLPERLARLSISTGSDSS